MLVFNGHLGKQEIKKILFNWQPNDTKAKKLPFQSQYSTNGLSWCECLNAKSVGKWNWTKLEIYLKLNNSTLEIYQKKNNPTFDLVIQWMLRWTEVHAKINRCLRKKEKMRKSRRGSVFVALFIKERNQIENFKSRGR